jgi:BirA family transcriptional regulator, biotin operon repressor / biotin---[acetyl-CoA-carboxylase] ligase
MIGRPRVHHRVCDSTNERAMALATSGAPHGTLVTADEQTAGRGRQGRSWTAPAGSAVLMSLVVRDMDELLPLAAAVAVCEACEEVVDVQCAIKWPNDIWVERRKLAGILVEARPQEGWAVLGIGLNVTAAPEDLPATSLFAAGGEPRRSEEVLAALLSALDRRLPDPPEAVLEAWRSRDALRGERVEWDGGEGAVQGIDDAGALVVETDSGRVTLEAGEVHLRT